MKKAVISTGGHQYLVSEGDELEVEKLSSDKSSSELSRRSAETDVGEATRKSTTGKKLTFEALLVIDGEKVSVGMPSVSGAKVSAEITEAEIKADKVIAIRYKAKKRVDTRRGHRQKLTRIKITKISTATSKK